MAYASTKLIFYGSVSLHGIYSFQNVSPLEEDLKNKGNPARTECDDATKLKICRIWVVSRAWLEPKPVWEDNYQDEEGGVEEEVEGGHPHLQVARLLSSSVAPQRHRQQLVHIDLENIS